MYAQRKRHWLINILALENNVPFYTTLWTIFVILSPVALEQCFVQWVQSKILSNVQDGFLTLKKAAELLHLSQQFPLGDFLEVK